MKYYVKVTKQVAETIIRIGVPLTMTSDGNCLLYQSELNGVDGVNLNERAANVGGSLVAESDALAEINGTTDTHAYCYTPVKYGGEGDTRDKDGFGTDMPDVSASDNSESTEENSSTTEESPSTENKEENDESSPEVSTDKKESEVSDE